MEFSVSYSTVNIIQSKKLGNALLKKMQVCSELYMCHI